MRKLFIFLSLIISLIQVDAQTPNGFLDFGNPTTGTTATTANTGFGGVRVGTGGGTITLQNPGTSIGTQGELLAIAPSTGSINSVGITSTEYGTAATTFTISFEVHLSGGASGNWYFFAGNGATFGSAQSSTFTGTQIFTGIQWIYGASSAITTNNRNAGNWNTTGITGTPFAQNTSYYVTVVGNNTTASVTYGASGVYSVAANTYDLWVNGVLVGNDLAKAQLAASTSINAFRFYGESSTGNVAQIALDNIRWYNSCVLPPTHLILASVPATGTVSTNLTTYTCEAHSGSTTGPIANSFTGAITMAKASGPGAISGTLNPAAVNGISTYANTQFDAAGTYTINASAASPIVNAAASGNIVISNATPSIALSSPSQTSASNINQSSTNNILSNFQAAVTTANATLNSLAFTTSGSYLSSDLSGNFSLYFSTSSTFGSASSIATTAVGAAGTYTFSGLTQAINTGTTGYFWIVADASGTSGSNRTLTVATNPTLTFALGTPTGTISVAGTKTFIDPLTPTLSAGTLTAFGTQCINGVYGPNSFTITGTDLNTNDITLGKAAGYTYSTTALGTYTDSLTLSQGGGAYSQTIYVKFNPTAAIAYTTAINVNGGGASSILVATSGTGDNGSPSVTTFTATAITSTTASSGGNTLSTTCGTITDKGVVWGTSANPTIPSINSVSNGSGTSSYTSNISSLSPNTTYYYRAYATNSNGVTTYGSNLSFNTYKAEPSGQASSFTCGTTTTTTIPLTWSAATGAVLPDGYLIKWSTVSYAAITAPTDTVPEADGATTKNIAFGTNTYTLTGLSSGTTYFFKIFTYTNSGVGIDYNIISAPQTTCATLTAPCLFEDFTSGTYPPTGWIQTTTARSTTAADYISAPGSAILNSNNGSLTTVMLTNPSSLSFYLGRSNNTNAKTMNIKVSTTSQSTGFTTIATYDHSNVPVSSYNQYTVSLAAYSSISTVWIQFEKVSGTTSPWRLDDVSVSCAPPCTPPVTAPTLFDTTSVTSNTATITWTRGSGDSVLVVARNGSAVNTDPSSGFSYLANATFGSGSQLGTGNYIVYKGTGTSATISGLLSNTTYHLAIYEYGSVSTCYNTTELVGNTTTKNPTVTLISSNPAISSANISAGATNNVIYRFTLNSVGSATLTGVTINTSGTYVASNITNFKCWYSADTIFSAGTDILLATKNTSLAAGSHVFPSFTNQAIANATNAYIFITCDLPCTATALNNISVAGLSTTDFSIAAGSKTGSSFAGGTQTIQSAIPTNVTSPTTSSCSNGATTVSWTTPIGCFSNILVFAKAGSFSAAIPTGTGVSYTADTVYGNGTAFDGGFCVYKGTLNSFIMSGLSNGTNYTYKIFTRNDLNWSSGITTNCTPAADIADNGCSTSNYTDLVVNYPISSTITDLNVGIKISHTYRVDLKISLISPDSTEILLVNQVGGSTTNFDAIIDDAGTANAFTSGNHTVDGTYDVTGQPQGVGVGTLASLIGKNAQGNWKIRVCDNAAGDVGSIVSAELFVTSCNSTAVVNSFTPTSGSAGTLITIKGSGFTGTSAVKFNNINSPSVIVNSDTQLTVEVPSNASSGKIAVYNASACPSLSASNFSYLYQSGVCGGGFTGLIISEIYDATSNNVFNIELYNPTSSAIILTGVYSIGIKSDNIGAYVRTINLTGSIPAGGIYTAALGTSTQTCSYSYDFSASGSGVNELDGVYLLNSGSVQDVVVCPNEIGYTITRNTTATGPSATFSSGDWTFNSTETCAGIGSFTPSPAFTINSHPIDVSICSFTMGVSASGTGLSYQWKYNDPTTMNGWLNVTITNLQATNSRNSGVSVSGATTDTLRLTGDLTYLYNYQFYCEVIKTSCTASSNAAQFNYDSKPVYRSVTLASGNWSNPANWEMALTNAGPWNSACTYPIASNSSEVIIQNGTKIILDFDNTIDKLTIENTGELELLSSSKITFLNSNTGADLIVNGKLTDRGSTGNGISFEDNSGTTNDATWTLGTNGTIVKTNTSSVAKYRDFYQGGIATIPATANWYYRYNGDGNPNTTTNGMYYPNLFFENTFSAGNFAWSGNLLSFLGASDFCRVKGNLNIGTSGIGTCSVYNNNINSNLMFIAGNLQVASGSTFTNQSYDTIVDTSHGNGSGIEVQGNIICNGSLLFNFGAGLIKLAGTSLQTLSSTTGGTFETYNLEINNTNHTALSGLTTNIFNNLIFTNGKISTNVLTTDAVFVRNTNTAAIIGGLTSGASKYVEGKLKWTTSGTGTYTFPIGHSTQNAQGFNINLTGASGSVIQAYLENNSTPPTQAAAYCDLETNPTGLGVVQVGSGLLGTDGILDSIGFNLASPLQWDITNPGGGITSYDLTVLANGGQDIAPITSVNGTAIRYLMKNGQPGNPGVATGTAGPSFLGTGYLACPTGYSLSGLTSFSTFTLNGSSPMSTALPVILTNFQVQAINESAHLSWTTSSEINNDKFVIERSADAHTFIAIGTVKGNGNSTQTNHYIFTDMNPLKGTNYYRLKQIDFDQKFDYSSIEAVAFNTNNGGSIHVYPNPSTSTFQVDLSAMQEDLQIHVIDMYGHTVLTEKFVFDSVTKSMVLNTEKLPSGQYILQLIGASTNQQIKINKQ